MKYYVLIPSRYDSLRLPKKSLIKIGQSKETLIEHVFKRCIKSNLADFVYVLTDHIDIVQDVNRFSENVILTDKDLESGTDRVCQGAKLLGARDDDFIINVQGDMAMIDPSLIDDLIMYYKSNKQEADIFTFANKMTDTEEILDASKVKIVLTNNDMALYFSRLPIPYIREKDDIKGAGYYKHLGVYGYSYKFLETFVNLPIGNLENLEKLEQLRALENGCKIKVLHTTKSSIDINTKEDVVFINKLIGF